MSRLAGLDINGWWDWGALRAADAARAEHIDGGLNSSVIRLASDETVSIGGIQATLAPHGRGPGWGQWLGPARYRTPVRTALAGIHATGAEAREGTEAAFRAVTRALGRDARVHVHAIPDTAAFDEREQDALLSMFRATGAFEVTLLWRPIATILGWLADHPAGPLFLP